jgi:hypothetical protein
VKEYCFVSWCNDWIPWTDVCMPLKVSFSSNSSGCPTGFYIHSTCLPYASFDFDVVRIFSLCLWMALEKHIVGNMLFLDAALQGVYEKKDHEETFGRVPSREVLWIAAEKHIVGNFLFLSAAFQGISSMDGSIHSIMERCDT